MRIMKLSARRAAKTQTIRGIDFLVSVSPYFFPSHMEASYDRGAGVLTVRFRYPDDDEPVVLSKESNDTVRLYVGEHTARCHSVRIAVDAHGLDRVNVLVGDSAIEAIERAAKSHPELQENYGLAVEALREHKDELAALAV